MKGNQQHIEDIFREAFSHHEMEVSTKVWAGVQSSLAAKTTMTATTAATAGFTKLAAVIGLGTIIGVGAVNEAIYINSFKEVAPHTISVEEVVPVSSEKETVVPIEITEEPSVSTTNQKVEIKPTTQDAQAPINSTREIQVNSHEQPPIVAYQNNENANSNWAPAPATKTEAGNAEESDKSSSESANSNVDSRTTDVESQTPVENNPECMIHLNHQGKAFISADGDGTNDFFHLDNSENIGNFSIRIFSTQGRLLFQSQDPNFEWYGTDESGGVLPNRTVCMYEIIATDLNGVPYKAHNSKGTITVVHK